MTDDMFSITHAFREAMKQLPKGPEELANADGKRLRQELDVLMTELNARARLLDPTSHPDSFFDPADPRLFGIFAALALVGLDRQPLMSVKDRKFYGSGVYALYYNGPFPTYQPIARTEHPIYVGKADPELPDARSPRQQGERLSARLNEHRKNIERAENLNLADFECRYLVVATGWQTAAESALIGLFKPIWNKEIGILLGFGKHGDSAETRRNKRSPWDVLHTGRRWAASDTLKDSKTPQQIELEVQAHFAKNAPVTDIQHIVKELIKQVGAVRTP